MTLAEMRTELKARGFEHLNDTLTLNMLNRAYEEINDAYPWPYLTATATGASPLTIPDFAHALNVIDTTNDINLSPEDARTIYQLDPTQNDTGAPDRWYWDGTKINTWPTTSTQLSVRYIKNATSLSADSDIPILPTRFHHVIVDGAICYAKERAGEYDANCNARYADGIQKMAYALLVPNYDSPTDLIVSDGSTDW